MNQPKRTPTPDVAAGLRLVRILSLYALLFISLIVFTAAKEKLPAKDEFMDHYHELMARAVTTPQDIADLYALEWMSFLPLSFPYEGSFIKTMDTPLPLILSSHKKDMSHGFPSSFQEKLVPVIKESITVYPVQILLDSVKRELNIYNADRILVASVPIDNDFQPIELAEKCFGTASAETADRMQLYADLMLENGLI